MSANERQVDGNHYASEIQHWDVVVANDLDYFQGQITKYVMRWKKKNGIKDLEKALHFLEKYIEVAKQRIQVPGATESKEYASAQIARTVPIKTEMKNPFGFDPLVEL